MSDTLPENATPFPEPDTRESYVFIMNLASFVDFERLEIAPGHELRRANADEIEELRAMILTLSQIQPFAQGAWESSWSGSRREKLPADSWRYFVVAYQGNNQTMYDS